MRTEIELTVKILTCCRGKWGRADRDDDAFHISKMVD